MKTLQQIIDERLTMNGFHKGARRTITKNDVIAIAEEYHEQFERKNDDPNLCCICHKNYVDSADGYDTCQSCLNNI